MMRPVNSKTLSRTGSRGNMKAILPKDQQSSSRPAPVRCQSVAGLAPINPSSSPDAIPRKPQKPGKPGKPQKPGSGSFATPPSSPSVTSESPRASSQSCITPRSQALRPKSNNSFAEEDQKSEPAEAGPKSTNSSSRLSIRPKGNGAAGFMSFMEDEKSEPPRGSQTARGGGTGAAGFLSFMEEDQKNDPQTARRGTGNGAAGFLSFTEDDHKTPEPSPVQERNSRSSGGPPGTLPRETSLTFDSPREDRRSDKKKDKDNAFSRFKRKGTVMGTIQQKTSQTSFSLSTKEETPSTPEIVTETLEDEYDVKYSLVDGKNVIRASTVVRLVEALTQDEVADPQLRDSFLITYRAFVSPNDLLEHLIVRYEPSNMSKKGPLTKRRVRVAGTIKAWLEQFFYDFLDTHMQSTLETFIDSMSLTLPTSSEGLRKIFQKLLKAENERKEKEEEKEKEELVKDINVLENIPEALRGEVDKFHAGTWVEMREDELAVQMTKVETNIFTLILPKEYLAWNKKNRDVLAPNISHMIKHFNEVSNWVRTQMVTIPRKESRIKMLQKFIRIMEELYKLNNFNGMMEILSGINSSPVRRMKKTFEEKGGIGKSYTKRFHTIETLLAHAHSYRNYRAHLKSIIPPCIPYLGVSLTDLTFILDGNPDYVEEQKLVHFFKWRKVSEIICELKDYQTAQYQLESSPPISLFLRSLPLHTLSEDECYDWSTKVEPKNQKGHAKVLLKLIQNEEALKEKLSQLKKKEAEMKENLELLKASPLLFVCLWEFQGEEGRGVKVDAGDVLESINLINAEWGLFKAKKGEKVYIPRSFVRRLYPRKHLVDEFREKEKLQREEKERLLKERKEREKREKEERKKERERKRREKEEKKKEKERKEREKLELLEKEKQAALEKRIAQAQAEREGPSASEIAPPRIFSNAHSSRSTSAILKMSSSSGSSSQSNTRCSSPPPRNSPSPDADDPSSQSPSVSPTDSPCDSPSPSLRMSSGTNQKHVIRMSSQKNVPSMRTQNRPSSSGNMAPLKKHMSQSNTTLTSSTPSSSSLSSNSSSSPLTPMQNEDEQIIKHLQQQGPPARPQTKPTPESPQQESPQQSPQQKPANMRLKLGQSQGRSNTPQRANSITGISDPSPRAFSTPRGNSSPPSPVAPSSPSTQSPGREDREVNHKRTGRMTIMMKKS